jgi:electron transfer flavoprotein alpha/beta subunit
MKLTILERVTLIKILPINENYLTHKIVADFKNQLYLSEKEIKDYEYKEILLEEGKVRLAWNPEKTKEKEVEVGEKLKEIVSGVLKKLDENKLINDDNASLYEKFIL